MKSKLKLIRNIILGMLFILYAALIIFMSVLVLNRNEYGYTRFGVNDIIFINKDNASSDYKEGSLVVTEIKLVEELKVGDKVFIYRADEAKQEVKVDYVEISEIVNNESTKYIKLTDGTSWGEDYIAGKAVKVYETLGYIIGALETRWLFFGALIVPVFFILLIEIYQFIITIKYEDDEEEEKVKDKQDRKPEETTTNTENKPVETPQVNQPVEQEPVQQKETEKPEESEEVL